GRPARSAWFKSRSTSSGLWICILVPALPKLDDTAIDGRYARRLQLNLCRRGQCRRRQIQLELAIARADLRKQTAAYARQLANNIGLRARHSRLNDIGGETLPGLCYEL